MGGLNDEGEEEQSNTQGSRRRREGVMEVMEGEQQTTQRSRKGRFISGQQDLNVKVERQERQNKKQKYE